MGLKGVGVRGDPDYPYINPLRTHEPPFIPTDRDEPCPYSEAPNVVRLRSALGGIKSKKTPSIREVKEVREVRDDMAPCFLIILI